MTSPDDLTAWMNYFKVCYHADNIAPALTLALELVAAVRDAEAVFRPIARILHVNGLHDAAVLLYERILEVKPCARETHSDLLIHTQLCGLDDQDAFDELERWNAKFIKPVLRTARQAETDKDSNRPLRIGFVSNDFGGEHSLNTAMAPWFMDKERRRNIYVLYSNAPGNIPIHDVFLKSADIFRRIVDQSDAELDQQIRKDRIDILIDMVGHMDHSRLQAYARRPAPVIASWIGIGIPTGSEAMDYFLADEIRVPAEVKRRYRENIVSFPKTAMAWIPPDKAPPLVPPPSLRHGYVMFGNLSRVVKIQAETFDLWAEVLRRMPRSKFLLKDANFTGKNVRRVAAEFEKRGVDNSRLDIRSGSTRYEHMATYNDIDVILDCYPQQGGVSSLEALWMGVPVVSYCNTLKPAGRVGQFVLSNIRLSALSVDSIKAYAETACFLAGEPDRLATLRSGLRSAIGRSPICDIWRFQRNVETAFRMMWARYCRDEPPEGFAIGDS